MNNYNVAIIGAGSIGALKPDHIDFPGSANILTHANAVYCHPRTQLTAIVDSDPNKTVEVMNKWNVDVYSDLDRMYEFTSADIVICAVPTAQHYHILSDLLTTFALPQLIIAEKPFCQNLAEAEGIKTHSEISNTPIMVDYIRRYAKGYRDFKALIDSGKLGAALNCRVLYTRGLFHEGCHAVDLMRYFFGECAYKFIEDGHTAQFIIDRDENDPTVYAKFEFDRCPHVTFMPCDGRKYGIFEIDICFENARYRFIDNGLYIERYPVLDENEWGHKSLNYRLTSVIRQETGLNTALYDLIENAVNFLDGNDYLLCTADDAIKVHKILEEK